MVWFKRDLRVDDHFPLYSAAATDPVLCLYIDEPAMWDAEESSNAHASFISDSLRELDRELRVRGGNLTVLRGQAVEVLSRLHTHRPFSRIYAHEETGVDWTFKRDIAVAHWARKAGVEFREFPQFGVFRRLKTRDGWSAKWRSRLSVPTVPAPAKIQPARFENEWSDTFAPLARRCVASPQVGGLSAGSELWRQFKAKKDNPYPGGISSPLSASEVCSRLSAHIAYGTLSFRRIVQETIAAASMERGLRRPMNSFQERLAWHCHYIQKLESEPRIEFECANPALSSLRRPEQAWSQTQRKLFTTWAQGQTGVPLVDACMRFLNHHGWINFRMRSMLVSFACNHLWLDWRPVAIHLARLFTDFEPGIHYAQVQMQAGMFGFNASRIYDPEKQQRDHDPDAVFVRRWLPSLAKASPQQIACHYRSSSSLGDYPPPIVSLGQAAARARQRHKIAKLRPDTKRANMEALRKHGSRRPR